jgi:cytochrome c biogenesis protein CcmG/thiol:disulfide interchange protein DsbE
MRHRFRRRPLAVALPLVAALILGACGSGSGGSADGASADSGSQPPSTSEAPSTSGLPRALAANAKQANQIVGEGTDDFQKRLEQLRGHPVVVNQWASWCTSCRFEFPFFADAVKRYRAEVAFVGLDSQDDRGSAESFLEEFPVGFPSILDPDARVAGANGGGQAWPTTMFFDRKGELVNVKLGAYATAELLRQDIERWALGRGS